MQTEELLEKLKNSIIEATTLIRQQNEFMRQFTEMKPKKMGNPILSQTYLEGWTDCHNDVILAWDEALKIKEKDILKEVKKLARKKREEEHTTKVTQDKRIGTKEGLKNLLG